MSPSELTLLWADPTDSVRAVEKWRRDQRARSRFAVKPVPWQEVKSWRLQGGHLLHESGGFFSVVGFRYGDRPGELSAGQPFILQPEIGILGFLMCRDSQGVHLLVQAKTEPGNCGGTQLSPSFQCTKSNYQRRHGGKAAQFLDFFLGESALPALTDSLQSEQGTRFIDKFNRNMVIEVSRAAVDLSAPDRAAWRWLSLDEMGWLLTKDLVFNTDARSVLAVSDWALFSPTREPFARWQKNVGIGFDLWNSYHAPVTAAAIAELLRWLEEKRQIAAWHTQIVGLTDLPAWRVTEAGVLSTDSRSDVAIRYYAVRAEDREVQSWTQPLITSTTPGLVLLVARRRDGVLTFGARLSREPGFKNAAQLSATVQVFPGESRSQDKLATLLDSCRQADSQHEPVLFDCLMSEEGGRFYQDINRYVILQMPDNLPAWEDDDVRWLTLAEINAVKGRQGVFTNEFRSVLSLLLRYL